MGQFHLRKHADLEHLGPAEYAKVARKREPSRVARDALVAAKPPRQTHGTMMHGRNEYDLKRRYGIGREEYDALYAKQGGTCAICHEEHKLFVDHDHKTKKVRGLLCNRCNMGIGYLRDSLSVLGSAIDYLSED